MSMAMAKYCRRGQKAALCVSGGVDSISMLHSCRPDLCRRHCPDFGKHPPSKLQPLVITIDHSLRPESAEEADMVCDRSRQLGMHAIKIPLEWHEESVPSNQIMEAARNKRYEAIANACFNEGCAHIFTAHHQGEHMIRSPQWDAASLLRITTPLRTFPAVTSSRPELAASILLLQEGYHRADPSKRSCLR